LECAQHARKCGKLPRILGGASLWWKMPFYHVIRFTTTSCTSREVCVGVSWLVFFCWPFFSFFFLLFSLFYPENTGWWTFVIGFSDLVFFFCIFILEPLLKFIYFQFNSSILICYISHFSIWSFFFWFLFFFPWTFC
jgi:hypothetical protein